MKSKVLIAVSCLLAGAGGMFLIMSSRPLTVVEADCPGEPGRPCGNGDVNGDGSLNVADAVHILQYLFLEGPAPKTLASRLPATGQTVCYHASGDCAAPNYPGQDAFYQAGCAMEGRFADNGDGTVTDNCTGFIWQKDTAPLTFYSWQEALHYCENLTLAGHNDWRLPNLRELQSIVDYGRSRPAIDPVFNPVSHWYWSSSTSVNNPSSAWAVDFWEGFLSNIYKFDSIYVRAVRGGL